MKDIEQEARDCLLVYSEIEHARITKALKAKQDRIDELEGALRDMLDQCTITYESQAQKHLKPEFVGKSRVWSDYGCWLYPGDCIYEVSGDIVEQAKKALGGAA